MTGPAPGPRSRWRSAVVAAVATILAVLGLSGLGWLWLARDLENAVIEWADAKRREGYGVVWRSIQVEGFPLAWRVRVGELALIGRGPVPSWRVDFPEIVAVATPWRRDKVDIVGGSGAKGVWGVAETPIVTLAAQHLSGEIRDGGTRLAVRLRNPAATGWDAGAISATELSLSVDRMNPAAADYKTESLAFRVAALGVRLPPDRRVQSGSPEPLDATFDVAIFGALPAEPTPGAWAQWRDAGGVVEISQSNVVWGSLRLKGSATVTVDERFRPLGAGTASIEGFDSAIDRMAARNLVGSTEAVIAKVVLGALSQTMPDGTRRIDVPLTAQDGWLSVGPVKLLALSPVTRP